MSASVTVLVSVSASAAESVAVSNAEARVHTSTVTVVVLEAPRSVDVTIDDADLAWSTCRASGCGGQHLQKTDSATSAFRAQLAEQRCE